MGKPMADLERPTDMARVSAGPIEYRYERRGEATVVVFHGGHVRASLPIGEDIFEALGYSILAPSRPGYGRTPLTTGTSPAGFADATYELCQHLAVDDVVSGVGISGGGPTALTMAARYPGLIRRLILESAVGFLPWPERRTRLGARIMFNAISEKAAWRLAHAFVRLAPALSLRVLLDSLSTEPPGRALAALRQEDRATLTALFSHMRSGSGFVNDLRATPDVTKAITQPTLVIATPKDGAVPFAHAESFVASIRGAQLIRSTADSHFIWFGSDYGYVSEQIRDFLAS